MARCSSSTENKDGRWKASSERKRPFVNLRHIANLPDVLIAKCNALQADMLLWRTGYRRDLLKFDGTVRSLLDVYEVHERSPYQKLKPASRRPYNHF